MKKTLQQLIEDFYDKNSDSWDDSRQNYWHSWQEMWQIVSPRLLSQQKISIMDVGCGNGRMLEFYASRLLESSAKTLQKTELFGIDISAGLLNMAEKRLESFGPQLSYKLDRIDVTDESKLGQVIVENDTSYDLISIIALLHHIPTQEQRISLLAELGKKIEPRGYLIFTTWEFLEEPQLAKKLVTAEKLAQYLKEHELELGKGDHIMSWGKNERSYRFVHAFDTEEKKELIEATGLNLIREFKDDGRNGKLNHIFILQAPSA
jgi:2-polyprenyl-3-methyl-5-hydroxy-6-metoxy-1,4-benzoquinol methylase